MKTKRIIRATVVAILVSLSVLSSTTIWSNSLAFEECVLSNGRCLSTGCSTRGGVCAMPEINRNGTAAKFDQCWCLF
jgi:hypothetical protein